jgi:hypothetical protein
VVLWIEKISSVWYGLLVKASPHIQREVPCKDHLSLDLVHAREILPLLDAEIRAAKHDHHPELVTAQFHQILRQVDRCYLQIVQRWQLVYQEALQLLRTVEVRRQTHSVQLR